MGRSGRSSDTPLEAKNDSGLVTEIALVLIALSKGVPEPCPHIIELSRPDVEEIGRRNVDPSTNDEIERPSRCHSFSPHPQIAFLWWSQGLLFLDAAS